MLNLKDKLGHNVFYYLQNMYKELSFIRMNGSGVGGPQILPRQGHVITVRNRNGSAYSGRVSYQAPSVDDIVIKDDSKKTDATKDREERERQERTFLRNEENRRKKRKEAKLSSYVNFSEYDDEGALQMLGELIQSQITNKNEFTMTVDTPSVSKAGSNNSSPKAGTPEAIKLDPVALL